MLLFLKVLGDGQKYWLCAGMYFGTDICFILVLSPKMCHLSRLFQLNYKTVHSSAGLQTTNNIIS